MAFRCPSDAQAALLRKVQDIPSEVWWAKFGESVYGGYFAPLYVEVMDREADTSHYRSLAEYRSDEVRARTVEACITHGWLTAANVRIFSSGVRCCGLFRSRAPSDEPDVLTELAMTEDGELALGLWQQRKLSAPPDRLPELSGVERNVLGLAARAERLGFVLMPATETARQQARALARGPYAQRGWGPGVGTRSLKPTGLGFVEVLPKEADRIHV